MGSGSLYSVAGRVVGWLTLVSGSKGECFVLS